MGDGNYLLNVVWDFWLYVRYLWGDVVAHLRFASSMKRCALGLITNSVTIPLVEGCSMGDTCTSQKSWKCLAVALKAPFVATTEPLSGCFYKGYKPSILLVLFYTPDVQTELFNVNEKEKTKQQCNLPQLLVENGWVFSVTEHNGLDKHFAAWKLRLIPLVLPNWSSALAGNGEVLSTLSLVLAFYLHYCYWEGWDFFLVRGYSESEFGP